MFYLQEGAEAEEGRLWEGIRIYSKAEEALTDVQEVARNERRNYDTVLWLISRVEKSDEEGSSPAVLEKANGSHSALSPCKEESAPLEKANGSHSALSPCKEESSAKVNGNHDTLTLQESSDLDLGAEKRVRKVAKKVEIEVLNAVVCSA